MSRPVMSCPGLYDPTTIMNADILAFCQKEGWCKLAFYLLSFFYYLYGYDITFYSFIPVCSRKTFKTVNLLIKLILCGSFYSEFRERIKSTGLKLSINPESLSKGDRIHEQPL